MLRVLETISDRIIHTCLLFLLPDVIQKKQSHRPITRHSGECNTVIRHDRPSSY